MVMTNVSVLGLRCFYGGYPLTIGVSLSGYYLLYNQLCSAVATVLTLGKTGLGACWLLAFGDPIPCGVVFYGGRDLRGAIHRKQWHDAPDDADAYDRRCRGGNGTACAVL